MRFKTNRESTESSQLNIAALKTIHPKIYGYVTSLEKLAEIRCPCRYATQA